MIDLKQLDSVINCNVQSFVYDIDISAIFLFSTPQIYSQRYISILTRPSIVILLLP